MGSIVIVGASLAGLRAAQAIRAGGHAGALTVIGDEARPPYTRPPLSKELLASAHTPEQCDFDTSAVEATWRLGEPATGLDLDGHRVLLASGEAVAFDRAIIATGCRAREWTGPGAGLAGLFTLRDLDDAIVLRDALADRPRVVVVGAGFVGCEVAATARKLGCDVTVLDVAPHPMLPLGPEIGERCRRLHVEHGVTAHFSAGVQGFVGTDRLEAVELRDGTRIDCDLAVVALGAIPNTDWLADSGLVLERGGILCDATLTAVGAPDVLCAGDVTSWPHGLAGGDVVRIEHWTNAAEQGGLAGRNVLLDPAHRAAYTSVPYFWSDQYDVKVQAVGFPGRADRVTILEEGDGKFVAAGVRGEQVVSAVAWNAPRRLMVYRRALGAGPTLAELQAQIEADEKALGRPTTVTG